MIENVERQEVSTPQEGGIGLYKIRYEMDVKGNVAGQGYIAGIISYNSEEAVNTLVKFCKKRVKGFKGLKIEECGFEGGCHAMSDSVRDAVLKTAILEGLVVPKSEHDMIVEEAMKSVKKTTKKSIVPKEAKS